jgi:hypothetical protein
MAGGRGDATHPVMLFQPVRMKEENHCGVWSGMVSYLYRMVCMRGEIDRGRDAATSTAGRGRWGWGGWTSEERTTQFLLNVVTCGLHWLVDGMQVRWDLGPSV